MANVKVSLSKNEHALCNYIIKREENRNMKHGLGNRKKMGEGTFGNVVPNSEILNMILSHKVDTLWKKISIALFFPPQIYRHSPSDRIHPAGNFSLHDFLAILPIVDWF